MADCYSRDEETFYDDLSDVLDMLDSDGGLTPGAVIHQGESVQRGAGHYLPGVEHMLESMGERAYDDCGEHVPEDWPGVELTKEKFDELEKLLRDWMDANVRVRFRSVTNVKPLTLTAEMIAEYRGESADGVQASTETKEKP